MFDTLTRMHWRYDNDALSPLSVDYLVIFQIFRLNCIHLKYCCSPSL